MTDDAQSVASGKKLDVKKLVSTGLDRALTSQLPVAAANVARLRRVHPDKGPAELISLLNTYYLGSVTATGAGAGAAAIVPNGWVQLPVAALDLLTFLEASVLYTLSAAVIHEVDLEDYETRKMLVMAALLGDSAAKATVKPLIQRTAPHLGKKAANAVPLAAINAANKVLGPRFVTRYGTRQGVLVLGKQLPMTIGVAIGAGGNHIFGRLTVAAARKILGPPPAEWSAPNPPAR